MIHGPQFSITTTMQMDKKVVIIIWSQNQVMNSFKTKILNLSILWFDIWFNGDYIEMKKNQHSQNPISYNFYVLSRNRLNSNIWHHYLIAFINNFPMPCQSLQYDMIYIFWPFKFHYKKLEILKNLNSQNERATSRSLGCFQSPLHISHSVWEFLSIPLFWRHALVLLLTHFVSYNPYFGHDLKSNVTKIVEMIENNVEGISFCLNNLKPMAPIVFITRSYRTHLRFCKFHYCWMKSLSLI